MSKDSPGQPDPAGDGSARALAEREELVVLAQAAGQFGIFEWRVQEGAIDLSPHFLVLYGLRAFDGRYDSWLKRIFREDVVRITDLLDRTFELREREIIADFRITVPGDRALRWMEARAVVFYDAAGRPVRVVGVNVDVTERKRAIAQLRAFTETLEERVRDRTRALESEHEARRKAEEMLRQAQKMEAVGHLTGGVAHDFNNLLTIIQGGLDTIGRQVASLEKSAAAARIARSKDMALEGVRRATTLIARLLAFARQQPLDPQVVDANRLVADVCELLRRTLGEAIALETVLAAGLWPADVDANQLENALVNLALNARDAMPVGGKMTIETANCAFDEAYVANIAEPVKAGQYVMIAVADSGVGMDRETAERAFDPFFTTKGVGKGTGLGLSQVYGFVRQSGGHVRIYSEVGEGTTVKVYLPRHLGAMAPAEAPARAAGVARAIGAERILVVEDDDAIRAHAVEVLRELGYDVLSAANGFAALETLERGPPVDLLFTDIVMPGGLNGRQLADEAVNRQPRIKVLFTTGYTRNAIVHQGRLDPGVAMIGKPFTFEGLAARVRAVLDGTA